MHAVRAEIMVLPPLAVGNHRRACGFNRSMVSRITSSWGTSRLGSSLSLFAILSTRSTGQRMLPLGSVGTVTGAGLAILRALLEV